MVLVQYSSYEMVFCGILGRKKMWYLVVFQRQTFGIPKKKVSGNPGVGGLRRPRGGDSGAEEVKS